MEDWRQKRGNWTDVEQMYKDPSFLVILAKIRRIWVVPYYWASIESSNSIKLQLIEDEKLMDRSVYFITPLIIVIFLVVFQKVILKFQENVLLWISILGVLPIDLLKRNLIGVRYLEKMALGGNKLY